MRKHHWYEEPRWARTFWITLVFTVFAVVSGTFIGCASLPPGFIDYAACMAMCDGECVQQDNGSWLCVQIPTCEETGCPDGQECVSGECVTPPEECLPEFPWCHETDPPMTCGECKHNPTTTPGHCEKAPDCAEPPPVDPPPVDPPEENMWFPIVPQDQITAVRGNPGHQGTAVNRAMAQVTGCAVGQEPCPISLPVDLWFQAVCRQLHVLDPIPGDPNVKVGWYCGRHVESPLGQVCPPGGGCTDQISVKRDSFCDGGFHENYRIINPAENGVRWYPSAKLDAWNVDCTGATWPQEPGTIPPPVDPPPSGQCVDPDPRGLPAEFVLHCGQGNGTVCDSTYRVKSREYCNAVCSPIEPDVCFTGRGACPMRMEGDPERHVCYEAVVAPQQWWCDGQPIDPLDHNPARARCTGRARTCTADNATCGEADG